MNAVTKIGPDQTVSEAEARVDGPAQAGSPEAHPAPAAPAPARQRKLGRYALMIAVPLGLAAGGAYFWLTGGRYQETENANLRQAKISIASDTAGRIVRVGVADNASVHAGDLLFEIDPEPYRIALLEADAALATARLNVEQLRAAYSQAVAQERASAEDVEYLQSQFKRQDELTQKGINTRSALDEARRDLAKAQAEGRAAEQTIAAAKAGLGGDVDVKTDSHPRVLAALAVRERAAYDLDRTKVRAPADGIVSQASSVKVGQFVGAGAPVFSLVETGDAWVEANFKETQLTNMRVGQHAEVVIDTFPDKVFHATLEAIGAGTGAEFSLLPAQNATGNWVKVTQRIPVRFRLDPGQTDLPLRTGMSATVDVDTEVQRDFASVFGSGPAHAAD